ncbi:asparagine synthase (glutamine-hydrolyzing) [Endozoicomonas sp. OPT23]|uniref:asparagine synthase (glutamine-hydrolyzing) n=1 Tax=Endozoicomonas sp. OPT23 TaxID=2072845 RepID=UPI00129A1823|nr:asparagine synthase (glutamine-hydrolyzing) [Endozoicomonas sp. OPT23]MRI34321.1 asparagine synthase (glutamine-hydrolyzing) [Endozoicomonas sp. OPT23]
MCGFAGFVGADFDRPKAISTLQEMGLAIEPRGPDSHGEIYLEKIGVGFSHRRLAILDLSEQGHQPMLSKSGRYVISFNGEIYNHLELRDELNNDGIKPAWRGHSDTETLLAAIEQWGLLKALQKAIGMFAIALWDNEKNKLFLARDRFGEKPLYYGWTGGVFLFGSELKALRAYTSFNADIDRNSLALFLRYSYIPAPYSIYKGISKLLPGTVLSLDRHTKDISISKYWDPKIIAEESVNNTVEEQAPETVIDDLEVLLKSAIKQQMMADVPLGAFLSGGVDSSLIVSLMQAQSDKPIKTFSIGFHDKEYNEAEHALAVARHLGTEHQEFYVTPDDVLTLIPGISDIYDEPFADSSQLPTYLVSRMAKEYVTVSLSGDAGDELFCGYNRYLMTQRVWSKLRLLPIAARKVIAKGLLTVSANSWNRLNRMLPGKIQMRNLGDKLHKAAQVISVSDADQLYLGLVSHFQDPSKLVIGSVEPATMVNNLKGALKIVDPIDRMMAIDTLTYLPDDILTKVDRAAMAVSLETRIPFLDHRVYEYAWSLPKEFKLRNGCTKWCLREILYRYVPKQLIERPKMGFAVPIDSWLRGPLKGWAESLLEEKRLQAEGFFDAAQIQDLWQQHLSGQRNLQGQLWNVLMFQQWFEKHHK